MCVPSLQVHLVTIYIVPVVMVVVIPSPTLSRSRSKKAIPSNWLDERTSQDEQKLPLNTFQGSPTTPEPPSTETEAVMITNQGTVDVPKYLAPPSQM